MAVLKLKVGTREESIPLTQDLTVLGRSTENAIYVDDRQASRNHCQVERFAGGWKLVDLQSRNGTKVNGAVVNQHVLRTGDRIEIGDTVLTFLDQPDETDPGLAHAVPGRAGRMPTSGIPTPPAAAMGAPPHAMPNAAPAMPPAAAGYPAYPPPYGAPPPVGYPPPQGYPGYPPQGYPPAAYPGYPPQGAPPAGWPPAAPPAAPPGYPPAAHPHPSRPPADRKAPRPMPAGETGTNPGVIVGVIIVVLALLGGVIMVASKNSGGGKENASKWKTEYDRAEKLYRAEKFDEASDILKDIPKSSEMYKNAQTILADIVSRKKILAEQAVQAAADRMWDGIKAKLKKYEDDELPTVEEEPLRAEIKAFVSTYPNAMQVSKARDAWVKMGGKPEDLGGGSGSTSGGTDERLAKEAEDKWKSLLPRVEMMQAGQLSEEEKDRLRAELRNFISRFSEFPEAAMAQQALRGMGVAVGPDPDVKPPDGDPKNFKELVALVDGMAAGSQWGDAVKLLDDWIRKDPTGPDATGCDDKMREVKQAANNWYLGREAEADSLAQQAKLKEAKEILEDAVRRLGEKAFFENVTAARKKIAGLEKAMGGGK